MLKLPNIPEALAKEISSKLMYELNSPKLNGEKLEICYEQVDKLLQTIKEYFPCKPKCSFCCKHDVVITQFEAEYISLKTGIKINMKPFTFSNHSDCPFLKDNLCSIYKYRPLICRTYHIATTPDNCEKKLIDKSLQYGTEFGGYGNPIFRAIGEWINLINNQFNYCKRDIRNFF